MKPIRNQSSSAGICPHGWRCSEEPHPGLELSGQWSSDVPQWIQSQGKREEGRSSGVVVGYEDSDCLNHQAMTRVEIARKLAALKGCAFAGKFDPHLSYAGPLYHVPSVTLVGRRAANDIGIYDEQDLFGGVVPYDYVATKAISHPLVKPEADAPSGWSRGFPEAVRHVALSGLTAFTAQDALRGGARLLPAGALRLKPAGADGAHGQAVISTADELAEIVDAMDPGGISSGLVLEENLADVTTCSVGRVVVGDLVATYTGTQRLTTDNEGAPTYGGSTLIVVRGDFDQLLAWDQSHEMRVAVTQACAYDAAANAHFPDLIASRRNYDVAQGFDASGRWRSGVLEQSWRIGGASGAEMAALEALRSDPAVKAVQASCVEVFGAGHEPPEDAFVYFNGEDRTVGPLTKYATVDALYAG